MVNRDNIRHLQQQIIEKILYILLLVTLSIATPFSIFSIFDKTERVIYDFIVFLPVALTSLTSLILFIGLQLL